MMPTFGAKYELIIGVPLEVNVGNTDQLFTITSNFTLKDNQIVFKIGKNNSSTANHSTITVMNAPKEMLGQLKQAQGQRSIITFKAGFESDQTLPEIFKGVVENVQEQDDGVTHRLKLTLSDGGSNIREFSTKRTYPKGTSVDTIVRDLIGDSGLAAGPIYQLNKEIQSPKSFSGSSHKALTTIADTFGLNYSIQDGIATLVPSNAGTSVQVIEINAENGMVGSPSVGGQSTNLAKDGTSSKVGVKVKVLLDGNIRPENFVDIRSEGVNGVYKVESVQHMGDYEGGTWFSEVTCKPTDYTIQSYNLNIPYREIRQPR